MHVFTDQTSVYNLIRQSFGGMESAPTLTPRGKSPLPEKNSPHRRIEPMTLHQAGQRTQHITNELFLPGLANSNLLEEDATPTRTLRFSAARGIKGSAPGLMFATCSAHRVKK